MINNYILIKLPKSSTVIFNNERKKMLTYFCILDNLLLLYE